MLRRLLRVVVACAVLACSPLAVAAPEAPPTAVDQFNKMYGQLQRLVAQLVQLKERYNIDSTADKDALRVEYDEKFATANALSEQLEAVAEEAYLAAPNQNTEIDDFIFHYLSVLLQNDDYTPALRLVKLLMKHGFQRKYFDYFIGMTHFAANDFETAGKYFKRAADNKEIDEIGTRYLAAADNYRTLWDKEQKIRAAEDKANDLPMVKLTTTKGDIVVLLYENEAPNTTANFLNLVEKKFYDSLKFHRVVQGFMAQTGDPNGDGTGGPGYTIPDEYQHEKHRIHFRGTLSMARNNAKNSGGSQFFLTFLPTPHLDGQYTAFGRVVEGEDVLAKLARCQPGDSVAPDKIVKATVLRKRNHRYEPLMYPDKK